MEEYTNYQAPQGNSFQYPQRRQEVPDSTAILVMGILSIVTCFCYGIPGLVLGIIALYKGNKSLSLYNSQPDAYDRTSYSNAKAGRVCAIIGLSLSAVYLLILVVYLVIFGSFLASMPWQNMKL